MLTRKYVESLCHQPQTALPTLVRLVNRHEPIPQVLDILLDRFGRLGGIVHLGAERFNLGSVIFQGRANFQFEIVNDHEIGEKG